MELEGTRYSYCSLSGLCGFTFKVLVCFAALGFAIYKDITIKVSYDCLGRNICNYNSSNYSDPNVLAANGSCFFIY